MPSIVICNLAKLTVMSDAGSTLWTILGLMSILILGVEKGSILDDIRLSSILVAIF
jgi:hypothetical protein